MDLNLTSTTKGARGGKNNHKPAGYGLLSVKNNGNSVIDISVDTFEGTGNDYKQRENEHIDIYFPDANGSRWTGTAAELKAVLTYLPGVVEALKVAHAALKELGSEGYDHSSVKPDVEFAIETATKIKTIKIGK